MTTFEWNENTYPVPEGWSGLSIEDWFYRLETVRDRMMNIDDEDLEPMQDEDGDDLDPEEVLLIREYGFQDGGHWESFRSWGVANWARQTGESSTDCEFRMSGIAREKIIAEKGAAMTGQGQGGGGLDPIEGVTLAQWAKVQAALAGGSADLDGPLAELGVDRARWDRVSTEWMARMSTDTTGAIATAYGNAFSAGGQFGAQATQAAEAGVAGDLSDEPIPYERYIEVQEAMSAASERGEDAVEALKAFGLSLVDFSAVGTFWSKKTQQEAMKYHDLYLEYSEKYRAKYSA